MYFYLVLAVNESQDVVAGDGVTAVLELILCDVLVADVDRFLTIELLRYDEQLLLFRFFLLLVSTKEGNKFAPSAILRVLTLQLVDILLAQQDGFLCQSDEEVLPVTTLMEFRQLVGRIDLVGDVVLLQEFIEHLLAFLLKFPAVFAQDGLYLRFCLCRAHEINP